MSPITQRSEFTSLSMPSIIGATRRGLSERLSDPYLTDHDRWVLRQFGRFLSGIAPEPDPRALRVDGRGQPHRPRHHAKYR